MRLKQTVVYKEHTLGILWQGQRLEVLNGLGSIGGLHFTDSPRLVSSNEFRPATKEDFDTFKVVFHPEYLS